MTTDAILGISAHYHDSAAALICDGEIIAAAQQERFSRHKHDAGFPADAIAYCLDQANLNADNLRAVAYYEKPFRKYERLLKSYLSVAPRGLRSFLEAMPTWMGEKLWIKASIAEQLDYTGPIYFPSHHLSHAASAFYPSPFERAAILTVDGVGEWCTTAVMLGDRHGLHPRREIHFPHSLGLLYSAFTAYLGFRVNDGEYKMMGLAPYGKPKYARRILEYLIDLKEDGSFRLNMKYFGYLTRLRMINRSFENLFGLPTRRPDAPLQDDHADIAASIQLVLETAMIRLARHALAQCDETRLCMAGGVALNCVANGRLLEEIPDLALWIQPAASDAGGALGAALAISETIREGHPGTPHQMRNALLGPGFSKHHIDNTVTLYRDTLQVQTASDDSRAIAEAAAQLLADGGTLGLFHGRMEFGPRALGGRSILADPRRADMWQHLNLHIKHRESFRPFAPCVLEEHAADWFKLTRPSPYMLRTGNVILDADGTSPIPAVTHVDGSARIQTVGTQGPQMLRLVLESFFALTGCPVLLNTSFNLNHEPIVCTPEDACRCFLASGLDALLLQDRILRRPASQMEHHS